MSESDKCSEHFIVLYRGGGQLTDTLDSSVLILVTRGQAHLGRVQPEPARDKYGVSIQATGVGGGGGGGGGRGNSPQTHKWQNLLSPDS